MTRSIRCARSAELPVIATVLHSAQLAISAACVRTAIEDKRVLVAVDAGRILGAIVITPADGTDGRIHAIAVRPRRRGQGIGTALVHAALDRFGSLEAEFDEAVRPFWVSLGCDIEPSTEPERYVGRLDAGSQTEGYSRSPR